jgi:predicted patatin/cPLA2 family phospholipase
VEDKNTGRQTARHALVVEGGAMRGIFSAGVLDAWIEAGHYPFDAAYGVSAGASNVSAYLAGMKGRNYKVYTDYMRRKPFVRPLRFLLGGHYMELDWLWEITRAEVPLDEDTILASPVDHRIVVTRSDTGEAEYLFPAKNDFIELLKASSAVPVLYRSYPEIRGHRYSDGGIADPIPAERAWRDGARLITVLRSRPHGYRMERKRPSSIARHTLRDHPALFSALLRRPEVYNRQVAFLRNPPDGCEIREIKPPAEIGLDRLTTDGKLLETAYRAGLRAGEEYLKKFAR